MQILLINRFFWPDEHGTARHATDLAEDLVAAGHAVTVAASNTAGGDPGRFFPPRDSHRGIAIHRVGTARFDRQRLMGWALNALSFYPGALWRILRLPRHGVTLIMSDPPMIFALGPLVRWMKRTRFVYWSMDLYPDVAVEAGVLRRGSLVARFFEAVSRWALRRADRVIAIGEVMRERLLAKGVAPERVVVCHNWTDPERVRPVPNAENTFAREHGLAGRFVVLYAGNMGLSHEFATMLEAARDLERSSDALFLLIGGGKQTAGVRESAGQLGNVRMLPYQPEDRLAEALSAAAVHVVTLKPGMEGTLLPSKLYSSLAAARPVVFVGPEHSEPAQIVARGGCGIRVAPGDAAGFAAAVERLRGAEGRRMGEAG
ncbi:MAG: glycosyltransferase family 4 protein, partial [bacterium]